MSELVIQPSYPFKTTYAQPGAVIVLGCGGTGSYLIPLLARSISTLTRKIKLILIDGDSVEDKNLKRQNFVAPDIGHNKAEVMATRYGAFGIEISSKKKFLESADELVELMHSVATTPLIVSCVDNAKTRMLVRNAVKQYGSVSYWIDTGNEEFDGQVVLSAYTGKEASRINVQSGLYPMPDVFDLYPELIDKATRGKLPTELSCAEMAESSPQYGFVNSTSANLAMNYAHDLLTARVIKTHAVSFSVANTFSSMPLTETELCSWCEFFEPMKSQSWIKTAFDARVAKQAQMAKDSNPTEKDQAESVMRSLIEIIGKKPAPKELDKPAWATPSLSKTGGELVDMLSTQKVHPVRVGAKTMV